MASTHACDVCGAQQLSIATHYPLWNVPPAVAAADESFSHHTCPAGPPRCRLAGCRSGLSQLYIYIYVYIVHIDSVFNFTPPAGPLQWGLPLKCGTHALCACSMIICGSLACYYLCDVYEINHQFFVLNDIGRTMFD
jgi:hypothetical protein